MVATVNAMPTIQRPDIEIHALNGSLAHQLAINPYDIVPMLAEQTRGKAYMLPIPYFTQTENESKLYLGQPSIAAARDAASQVNVFVFRACALDDSSSFMASELITPSERSELAAKGAVAEFAGRFLGRYGREVELEKLHSLSAGIDLVASGVQISARFFALATGKRKKQALLGVLRSGILTDLVVDEALVEEISAVTGESINA